MRRYRFSCAATAVLLMAALAATRTRADDASEPPPPQHTWIGKGQFGFVDSKGNTTGESANGNLDLTRYDFAWKNELYLAALYGQSAGIVSAERFEGHEQTNYNFTKDYFAFGGLRYEHDLFDGFVYQASLTGGVGYNIFASADKQLTVQLGAGYRRMRPEIIDLAINKRTPLDQQSEAIGTAGLNYLQKFNEVTTLTNKLVAEVGAQNTLVQDNIQLAVKMTTKLALAVGYTIIDNSNPPPPLKKVDTTTNVNLQFSF